jgi:hypothetical protein
LHLTENELCNDLEVGSRNKQLAANTKPSAVNETEERPEERQIENFNKDAAAHHSTQLESDSMPCTETIVRVFTGKW